MAIILTKVFSTSSNTIIPTNVVRCDYNTLHPPELKHHCSISQEIAGYYLTIMTQPAGKVHYQLHTHQTGAAVITIRMAAQPPTYGASAPLEQQAGVPPPYQGYAPAPQQGFPIQQGQGYAPPPPQGYAPPPQQGFGPPPQQGFPPQVI